MADLKRSAKGMIFGAIEAVIDFVTLRSAWKKKPSEVESEMKKAYSESKEAKQLDALAAAVEKKPIQPPQTTTGSSAPDRV